MPRVYTVVAGRAGEARRLTREVKQRVLAALHEGTQRTRSLMVQNRWVPVARGQLQQSIRPRVLSTGPRPIGIVGTPLLHGLIMETGRTPGRRMPPQKAIEAWAAVKGKTSKEVGEKLRSAGFSRKVAGKFQRNTAGGFRGAIARERKRGQAEAANVAEQARDSMIFRIQRAIAKRGIRIPLKHDGRGGMFKRASAVMEREWPRILNRHLRS